MAVSRITCLFVMVICIAARAQTPETDVADQRRTISVDQAVIELIAEAKKVWAETKDWPTTQSDFAQRTNAKMPEKDATGALMRRLHPNPALDAYIKWQFLSFIPEVEQIDVQNRLRIVRSLPRLLDQPEPRITRADVNSGGGGANSISMGMQQHYIADLDPIIANGVAFYKPVIGTISTGTILQHDGTVTTNSTVMTTINTASVDLIEIRKFIDRLNVPNFRYRDDLDRAFPDDISKVNLLHQDVEHRLYASDPTVSFAMQRLVDATARMRNSREINTDTRRRLIGSLQHMKAPRDTIIRSIEVMSDTQFQVHREEIKLPDDLVEQAVTNLSGKVPTSNE